jgi:hypothetical protein
MTSRYPLADRFRQFVIDDGGTGPNGYVMALEAVLAKCAELRTRRGVQYPDEVAAEFEQIFADYFGIRED